MAEKKNEVKHFRCEVSSALSVLKDGETVARFTPYFEKFRGETVKVGYLETDDPFVIERCEADGTVESVSEKEFKDATGDKASPAPIPVG